MVKTLHLWLKKYTSFEPETYSMSEMKEVLKEKQNKQPKNLPTLVGVCQWDVETK